jgi:hypothetical protein
MLGRERRLAGMRQRQPFAIERFEQKAVHVGGETSFAVLD